MRSTGIFGGIINHDFLPMNPYSEGWILWHENQAFSISLGRKL